MTFVEFVVVGNLRRILLTQHGGTIQISRAELFDLVVSPFEPYQPQAVLSTKSLTVSCVT